jgi:cystathionine beta-lyase/cystathionine gamma-synthase
MVSFTYVRTTPNQARLEEPRAAVEGGKTVFVFAYGMAAGAAYLQYLPLASFVSQHIAHGQTGCIPRREVAG